VKNSVIKVYQNITNLFIPSGNLTMNFRMFGSEPNKFGVLIFNSSLQQKINYSYMNPESASQPE
jgi:hypothetical protein